MRALWNAFGKPGSSGRPGHVTTPYTSTGLREALARLAGSRDLADAFFDRHVEGRRPMDWAPLFERAGILVQAVAPGRATIGDVSFDFSQHRGKVSAPIPFRSPAYLAGLAQDDELERVGDKTITSAESLRSALRDHRPGDEVELTYRRRDGQEVTAKARLIEHAEIELVPVERAGRALSPEQRMFRDRWIGSRVAEPASDR